MADVCLSPWERACLGGIEQQLREQAPALDRALAVGLWRSPLATPPRTWRNRSAWPVAALAVLGCLLVAVGCDRNAFLPLVVGTYLLSLSFLGLWVPLLSRRTPCPRAARAC